MGTPPEPIPVPPEPTPPVSLPPTPSMFKPTPVPAELYDAKGQRLQVCDMVIRANTPTPYGRAQVRPSALMEVLDINRPAGTVTCRSGELNRSWIFQGPNGPFNQT